MAVVQASRTQLCLSMLCFFNLQVSPIVVQAFQLRHEADRALVIPAGSLDLGALYKLRFHPLSDGHRKSYGTGEKKSINVKCIYHCT